MMRAESSRRVPTTNNSRLPGVAAPLHSADGEGRTAVPELSGPPPRCRMARAYACQREPERLRGNAAVWRMNDRTARRDVGPRRSGHIQGPPHSSSALLPVPMQRPCRPVGLLERVGLLRAGLSGPRISSAARHVPHRQSVENFVDKAIPPTKLHHYRRFDTNVRAGDAMSWTTPSESQLGIDVTCSVCGRRAPRDPSVIRSAGWQVRYDYPLRFRCRRCRERHEREAA